jgi:hypothetical protein
MRSWFIVRTLRFLEISKVEIIFDNGKRNVNIEYKSKTGEATQLLNHLPN